MRTLLAAAAVAALFLTTGCGPTPPSASTDAKPPHNPTDVEFAQMMIPHHEQAIEMSKLAATQASSQQVKDLASDIEAAQQPEIDTMKGWLESWDAAKSSMDMSHDQMPGMANDDAMAKLKQANGAEFDQLFLTLMIAHHEGAISMAKSEKADGINPKATELADAIITTQTAEIAKMKSMLR